MEHIEKSRKMDSTVPATEPPSVRRGRMLGSVCVAPRTSVPSLVLTNLLSSRKVTPAVRQVHT